MGDHYYFLSGRSEDWCGPRSICVNHFLPQEVVKAASMAVSVSTAFVSTATKDHCYHASPPPTLSLIPTRKPPRDSPLFHKSHRLISSPFHRSIYVSAISSSPGVGSSTVEALNEIEVLDLEGNAVPITALWEDRKAVVAFARHFGCVFCRKRADYLATKKELMDAAGAALVLIGPGNIEQARAFSQQTKFKGEVYADPNQSAYAALKFVSGASTTFTPKAGLKIIQLYMEGYRQDWKLTFQRETVEKGGWQQGGILIAGPGKSNISYVYKDKEAGDEPPVEDVLKACCTFCRSPEMIRHIHVTQFPVQADEAKARENSYKLHT